MHPEGAAARRQLYVVVHSSVLYGSTYENVIKKSFGPWYGREQAQVGHRASAEPKVGFHSLSKISKRKRRRHHHLGERDVV